MNVNAKLNSGALSPPFHRESYLLRTGDRISLGENSRFNGIVSTDPQYG